MLCVVCSGLSTSWTAVLSVIDFAGRRRVIGVGWRLRTHARVPSVSIGATAI